MLGSNVIKKGLQHRCFPENIAKFSRTAFFKEHLRWLRLMNLSLRIEYELKRRIQNPVQHLIDIIVGVKPQENINLFNFSI